MGDFSAIPKAELLLNPYADQEAILYDLYKPCMHLCKSFGNLSNMHVNAGIFTDQSKSVNSVACCALILFCVLWKFMKSIMKYVT